MRFSPMLAVFAILSACGNTEPSEADLQSAMLHFYMGPESSVIDDNHIKLENASDYRQYVGVKKLACQPGNDNPGFACDITLETCSSKSEDGCKAQAFNVNGRFVDGDKGWQFIPSNMAMTPGRPIDILHSIKMADITASGGIAGCFSTDMPERDQEAALRLGSEPCK